MKQLSRVICSNSQLTDFLSSSEVREADGEALSILAQIYSASQDTQWLHSIAAGIASRYPQAIITGATTCGEIHEGETVFGQTIVTFYFFRTTRVHPFVVLSKAGMEAETGRRLRQSLDQLGVPVRGALLLTTPLTIDSNEIIRGFNSPPADFPVFGAGAGDNAMKNNHVICGSAIHSSAAVVIAFDGPDFQIEKTAYHGWKPMSNEMTITKASDLIVHTIDNQPALDVYRRYFDIQDDEDFFGHALGFPLLICRDSKIMPLVPVGVGAEASLKFISEIHEGEKIRIGFMDPLIIRDHSIIAQQRMIDFAPEAILIFSCGSRRWVLREDVLAETKPFQAIAPTAGFYTIGEFCSNNSKIPVLNLNCVVVGMREGVSPRVRSGRPTPVDITRSKSNDVYISTHSAVISRLLNFISAQNIELEKAHHKILLQSITDKLTRVFNRAKLDDSFNFELARAKRYGSVFSIVLLDIDQFKQVNDAHGHNVGDAVLVRIAEVLHENIRRTDILGRWGGEEFLIILTDTGPDQAYQVAEKLRMAIATADFPVVQRQTASFGVSGYHAGDDISQLLCRADRALYEAKANGRNNVVLRQPE